MTQKKAIGVAAITAVLAYVVWRVQASAGNPIIWVNPMTLLAPNNPSPVASEGNGSTNAASAEFNLPFHLVKRPGNLSAIEYTTRSRMTAVGPLLPPEELTMTAQPQKARFVGEGTKYLPNLGDPNLSAYDYLASTPPDLAWGLSAGGGFRGI